jgi:hypothetical protein
MTYARNKVGLHAVRDGTLVQISDPGVVPAPGYFGAAHTLRRVGLQPDGQLVAAVADSGQAAPAPARTMVIGNYQGGARSGHRHVSVQHGDFRGAAGNGRPPLATAASDGA